MKCFVTGGAGFIGSHLVDKLLDEDNQVTVYDNFSSGKLEFIQHHIQNPAFKYIKADLLDANTLKRALAGHDIVFHFSANPDARWGIENTKLDLEQETIATYNVLECMRVNCIRKIVFASSGTIYGETPVMPLSEDYGPVLPISLYGAGKLASESMISAFCHTFGMQAWLFRLANIVGPRTTHGVIFDFINKLKLNPHELEILGDGTQCKPYLHVQDCVAGILVKPHEATLGGAASAASSPRPLWPTGESFDAVVLPSRRASRARSPSGSGNLFGQHCLPQTSSSVMCL